MKKLGIVLFALTLTAGVIVANCFSISRSTFNLSDLSLGFRGIKGSGNIGSEARDLRDFHALEVGSVFQVTVTSQQDYSVRVEADDNLVPLIRTEVIDGVLKIDTDQKVSPRSRLHIFVSAPNIDSIDASGVSEVDLSNASNTSLEIESSGASRVGVAGKSSRLKVDLSGAAKVNADDLAAGDAEIDTSGASQATINVSGELRADATGASRVIYVSEPASVQSTTSGAGKILKK